MSIIYYRAFDVNFECIHQHQTVTSAAACITWAGGYVVGVEDGIMRALTDAEEAEFQSAMYGKTAKSEQDADSIYRLRRLLGYQD